MKWLIPPWLIGLGLLGWRAAQLWRGEDWRAAVLATFAAAAFGFGYWAVVTPIFTLVRLRRIWRLVQQAHATGRLSIETVSPRDREFLTEQTVDLIARDSGVPTFIARRVVQFAASRIAGSLPDRRGQPARPESRTP
jgi:hypothetical protein